MLPPSVITDIAHTPSTFERLKKIKFMINAGGMLLE